MSADTVECFNCGNTNPAWAQVCRSCGAPIAHSAVGGRGPGGIFPTDQASLISIGVALGSIALAIAVGLFFSGIIPPAPNVPDPTPTPTPIPSVSAEPSISAGPSTSGSETPVPTPPLIGTISFGYGLNTSTHEVTDPTGTFGPGTRFSYSILLPEPFGVSSLNEEVVRVEADGSLKVVQARENESIPVTPGLKIAGYSVRTSALISVWGTGDFIIREYRGAELIAQGEFTFTN